MYRGRGMEGDGMAVDHSRLPTRRQICCIRHTEAGSNGEERQLTVAPPLRQELGAWPAEAGWRMRGAGFEPGDSASPQRHSDFSGGRAPNGSSAHTPGLGGRGSNEAGGRVQQRRKR